jgi:hypothetical protein
LTFQVAIRTARDDRGTIATMGIRIGLFAILSLAAWCSDPAAAPDAAVADAAVPPDGAEPDARGCVLPVLFDDEFDDGDLATGDAGGFEMRSNGPGNSTITETDGVARIVTADDHPGNEPNVGIGSIVPFDAAALADHGITVRWELSHADSPIWNGIALFVTADAVLYEGNTSLALHVVGSPADWFDPTHVGLKAQAGSIELAGAAPYQADQLADGLVAELWAGDGGWAYRIEGLHGDGPIAASGEWSDAIAFGDLFDADVHVGAAIQADNSDDVGRRVDVARITVSDGRCP